MQHIRSRSSYPTVLLYKLHTLPSSLIQLFQPPVNMILLLSLRSTFLTSMQNMWRLFICAYFSKIFPRYICIYCSIKFPLFQITNCHFLKLCQPNCFFCLFVFLSFLPGIMAMARKKEQETRSARKQDSGIFSALWEQRPRISSQLLFYQPVYEEGKSTLEQWQSGQVQHHERNKIRFSWIQGSLELSSAASSCSGASQSHRPSRSLW